MKFEKISALIEKAGFVYITQGKGIGGFEGYQVSHFEKQISGANQYIQLALLDVEKDTVGIAFSLNVPVTLRDAVYAIMKEVSSQIDERLESSHRP